MSERYLSGEFYHASLVPRDGSGVIALPTATPTIKVIEDSTAIVMDSGTMHLSSSSPIVFSYKVLISAGYGFSDYTSIITYDIAGDTYYETDSFRVVSVSVVPTTTVGGSITSMRSVNRVGGQWLMMHGNDAKVVTGYRPE